MLTLALALTATPPLAAERTAQDLEREEFLREARIGHTEITEVGVTAPLRATLSTDELTHDAHIQRVNLDLAKYRTERRTYVNFKDRYQYNIAGYRLDRLLGLNMVPVSVERSYRGQKVAVTWWIDDVLMTDADRFQQKIQPPDMANWNDQKHQARVFSQLIYNEDPNLGNFVITKGWRLWMIDFTRAFRRHKQLLEPERIVRIDRRFYEGLQALDAESLKSEAGKFLSKSEMSSLMARRDLLLKLLDKKIAEFGEARVICDLPGH